ncbi:MAG TPA: hypothetical protein PKA00_15285 [Saprospiraceae bacterium]|nr:hypothetical protein [Saprospiraceae bacterium]HMQ84275.1 hypothetical protein [Saprospiraceae bacterium]
MSLKKRSRIFLAILGMLSIWIIIDLKWPVKRDISIVDGKEIAAMETAMWRSYYEKKKVRLLLQSAKLMRKEFHFPYWRSYQVAFFAAKAAFAFQDGQNRADYNKALPALRQYYGAINDISTKPFEVAAAAESELEWWIIRRERETHPPEEWEHWIKQTAAIIYHRPADAFHEFARQRVNAMLLRDEKGDNISAADWTEINRILDIAWLDFEQNIGSQ